MENNNIVVVSAFFNVGREIFKAIPRTNDVYFENFKFWARMKNKLIVYTDPVSAKRIMSIRKEFGLEKQTHIVEIEDIYEIDPEIISDMRKISANDWFRDFRLLPDATSNIAEYSYLMLLKAWFLKDAVEKGLAQGTVAWIDFGFNHGGDLYTNPEEFSFEWKYDFSKKIHLYYYREYDQKPIFEIVRRLCDCFMGCLMVLPDFYCEELWRLNRDSMKSLIDLDLIDDDQLLLLMSYRKNPDIFEIEQSDWFLPLKEHGAEHLSIRTKRSSRSIKSKLAKVRDYIKRLKLVTTYVNLTRNNLMRKK